MFILSYICSHVRQSYVSDLLFDSAMFLVAFSIQQCCFLFTFRCRNLFTYWYFYTQLCAYILLDTAKCLLILRHSHMFIYFYTQLRVYLLLETATCLLTFRHSKVYLLLETATCLLTFRHSQVYLLLETATCLLTFRHSHWLYSCE